MNWFKNLGLRSKMLVSFMLVIALTMALVVLAVGRIRVVGQDYQAVIEHPIALRATLQEFSLNFTNIRRVNTVMAFHRDLEEERQAQLTAEENTAYYNAQTLLDQARRIIDANPALTQAEKEARSANNDALRELLTAYYDNVTVPIAQAASAHDYDSLSAIIDRADAAARAVGEKHAEMLASARETAAAQTLRAEQGARDTVRILITISIAAVAFAFAAALYIADYIARPLAPLTTFMTNMASAGDIAFSPKDAATLGRFSSHRDEVGRLIVAAIAFVGRIQEVGKALDAVSEGDLTSGIPRLSDRDSMGFAFKRMLANLNGMCAEIARSSVQVATGANQVTAAAQALSSGSTEQAASIEELSVAIASVDDMTKETADIARRAADLACGIKASAERSSVQMEGMMAAIDGINQASQAIRKIIRTIDEIAFQTNILAVNAAVEAAHAGKYGRGFSVVATAVRNLAAKSAEAAKDTERLIANTIEKAEEGVRIAGETSASLTDIVSGINDNNLMVTEIARLSEDQSSSISQINVGVSQVTKVVYRNSSTAEESAAASEEMARQSVTLQKLAGQFRLAAGTRPAEEGVLDAKAGSGRPPALLLEG